MTGMLIMTGCTTAGDGALTSQRLMTGQGAGQTLSSGLGIIPSPRLRVDPECRV
jgi:hypothetical protein